MEEIIRALLEQNVSSDQFYGFMIDYGLQEEPFVQEVLQQLIEDEAPSIQTLYPQWTEEDADNLLNMLKSPEKYPDTEPRAVLNEISTNIVTGGQIGAGDVGKTGFTCDQCGKVFSLRKNLNRHVKSIHDKVMFPCHNCGKSFKRNTERLEHESKCRGTAPFNQYSEVMPTDAELSENEIGSGNVGKTGFTCDQCGKVFSLRKNLNSHVKSMHDKVMFPCHKCGKSFTRNDGRVKHETKCSGPVTFPCQHCDQVLKTARQLEFHLKIKHKIKSAARKTTTSARPGPSTYNCRRCDATFQNSNHLQVHNARQHGGGRSIHGASPRAGPSTYKCRRCPAQFPNRQELHAHTTRHHYQVGAGLHPERFQQGQAPWNKADGSIDEGLRDCYRTNRALILERYREGPVESIYNIPMFPGMRIWDIGQALQGIYDRQQ
ncbi:zinc finger protein 761-like [Mercenaria mercenaria]|uniref:zinc finger protein 761-like n=1 Tax=Mercenaria mercenaria TaxID=6596 RepID=UPI00234FB3DA|nr:zinc finger protein 761-like [Mercenaria mercenaria]